jgi:hypothetical protein
MNVSEGMLASGLGIMGAAGALWVPVAQMDPITTGTKLAQLGVPGIMGVAVVGVTIAFGRILRDKDKIVADRFAELKQERAEYAVLIHEATAAFSRNSEVLELVVSEQKTTSARLETAITTLTAKLSAIEIIGGAMVDAVKHCQQNNGTRRGVPEG